MSDQKKPAPRFYVDDALGAAFVELAGAEAHHARKSRRLKEGCEVELFNGRGGRRLGVLEGKGVRFTRPRVQEPGPANRLGFAVSPLRGDRMDFLVEKLSELGADDLIPTVFSRSLDAGIKLDTSRVGRWRRTAVESAKQCGRSWLLEVRDPVRLADLCTRGYELIVLLDPGGVPFDQRIPPVPSPPRSALFIIGPEGGLTSEESSRIDHPRISLGARFLRVETAALAAAALYRARWESDIKHGEYKWVR